MAIIKESKDSKKGLSNEQKHQFYERLRRNRALVLPEGDLLETACKLKMPCIGIIEEPLVTTRRKKKPEYNKDKPTEITSKIMRMSVMNLMWNVNECSIYSMSSKIKKSNALNFRK